MNTKTKPFRINCIPIKSTHHEQIYESTLSIHSHNSPSLISLNKKDTLTSSIKKFFKSRFSIQSNDSKQSEKSLNEEKILNSDFVKEINEIINSPNFELIKQFILVNKTLIDSPSGDHIQNKSQFLDENICQSIENYVENYLEKKSLKNRNSLLKKRKKFRVPKRKILIGDEPRQSFRVSDQIEKFENLNQSLNTSISKSKDLKSEDFKVWSPKVIEYICKKNNSKLKINRKCSSLINSKPNTANPSVTSYHSVDKSEVTMAPETTESLISVIEVKSELSDLKKLNDFRKNLNSTNVEVMSRDEILQEKLLLDKVLFKLDWNLRNKDSEFELMKKRYNLLRFSLDGLKCSKCSSIFYPNKIL
ncbi:unnamed protein product [Brachionus calyciflorus]|uniref:Uncharacterized protein n=1 Tax=Brachionus calyciflorus TaxID=104777 RepID=A0A814AKG9_9BILA|nr:unnamed protein product [Brachionus calyciflorus]